MPIPKWLIFSGRKADLPFKLVVLVKEEEIKGRIANSRKQSQIFYCFLSKIKNLLSLGFLHFSTFLNNFAIF